MQRFVFLQLIANLFEFKTIFDEKQNVYIVFSSSSLSKVNNVEDHTQFEAVENHIHLMDNIKNHEYQSCLNSAYLLGNALLCSLHAAYPTCHFVVFVTVQKYGSMTIRFHQKWQGEEPYYDPMFFSSEKEKVFKFEN